MHTALLFRVLLIALISPLFGFAQSTIHIEAEDWVDFLDQEVLPGTQPCEDEGGGLNVGWTRSGEWLAWEATWAEGGDYVFVARVATGVPDAKSVRLEIDGIDVSGSIESSRWEGWQSWFDLSFAPIAITAGPHTVKLHFETGYFNINWIEFQPYVAILPTHPTGLIASEVATTGFTVDWEDDFLDESAFLLYLHRSDDPVPTTPQATLSRNVHSYVVSDLTPGETYRVGVAAENSAGLSAIAWRTVRTLYEGLPAAVPVGAGSVAAFPPYEEADGEFQGFALNPPLTVVVEPDRPLPTNDWWTQLLTQPFNSTLWSEPQSLSIRRTGLEVRANGTWNADGTSLLGGPLVRVSLAGVEAFRELILADWSAWGVRFRLDGGFADLSVTTLHGSPFTWLESESGTLELAFDDDWALLTDSGAVQTLPATGTDWILRIGTAYCGLSLPSGAELILDGDRIRCVHASWAVLTHLTTVSDFALFAPYAPFVPRETALTMDYDPIAGTVQTIWSLSGTDLSGGDLTATVQGFIPHHYEPTLEEPEFLGNPVFGPRGDLRFLAGNDFIWTYPFDGLVLHYPASFADDPDSTFRADWMEEIIANYAASAGYSGDTYWGGKDLVMMGKYVLIARDLGSPSEFALAEKFYTALEDWLTYTPGETNHYFARYPGWPALIGFDESYGSARFTDNHFHYGYLIHAAALMGLYDRDWVEAYAPVLRSIARQYANWDTSEAEAPWLRTFDPWIGHSYAGGLASPGGNNQESTSEAMQSWIGLYGLAEVLGDEDMLATAAGGYVMEGNATLEYWFNRSGSNWSDAYAETHDIVGILWNNGYVYATYFGSNPAYIYGIQWLPMTPGFENYTWNYSADRADALYAGLFQRLLTYYTEDDPQPEIIADGIVTPAEVGREWGNAILGYRLLHRPEEVVSILEDYGLSADTGEQDMVFSNVGGLTYYYAHARRT